MVCGKSWACVFNNFKSHIYKKEKKQFKFAIMTQVLEILEF